MPDPRKPAPPSDESDSVAGDTLKDVASAYTGDGYTVAEGDTLERIAQRHYGDAAAVDRIVEANREVLDGDGEGALEPGLVLVLPRGG